MNAHARMILILTLIFFLAGGLFFYRFQQRAAKAEIEKNLTAIARLKADQITSWRKDQLEDASEMSALFRFSIPRFLADPSKENAEDNLMRFRSIAVQHDFDDMILVTPEGEEVLSLSGKIREHMNFRPALKTVTESRESVFLDLHREENYPVVHSTIVAPLFKDGQKDGEMMGFVILITDARKFLNPLIQAWPTADKTAETLLVSKDGDHVIFLNDLRHHPDAALNLRIPLTRTDNPAVMAVSGKEGYVEGKDYRGVEVSAILLHIPDSPWYMVAKIDKREAFSKWRIQSALLLFLMTGLTLLIGSVGLVMRQREKKVYYQSLYQSEALLSSTLENHSTTLKAIGDAVISTDIKGQVMLMNPVAEALTGWTQQEALGRPLEEVFCIIHAESREKSVNPVQTVLTDGVKTGVDGETLLVSRNGREYRISDSAAPIRNENGDLTGMVLVFRDITREVETEARLLQAQKMESIGTLAGGIAHDFNNILFPILGHTELLMDDCPDESPFRGSLNQIYSGALRARDLVQQILTFSRQGKNELKIMKMQPVVKEALKLIRSTIPATIAIKQNIQPDCGAVTADPTQIHQIIMNLATNAFHAMEETGGELSVNLKQVELGPYDLVDLDMKEGTFACLSVSDTGKGMPREVMDRMFEPFFTTKGQGKGTGLGLSVVHGIVKHMGGSIQVYSDQGKGTQIHVYLPVIHQQEVSLASKKMEPVPGGTERILLVDDEADILAMEKKVLERLGYHVETRISPVEALEAFKAKPDRFDLIISDLAMPKTPGDKLSLEILRIRPGIPILLCTGFSETISEETIKTLGISGILMKPVVTRDLAKKIRDILDKESDKP